ncbi:MAG: PAS domain S-box protein [Candidatus Omnitrophica bacterium]|nr:PAS domain S-box protein [Candidatus Omnitrophota bacterium]
MKSKKPKGRSFNIEKKTVLGVLVILLIGVLGIYWTIYKTNKQMQKDFSANTHLIANVLDVKKIQSLTGTTEDLYKPQYKELKEKFKDVCATHPEYRFLYLMGRRGDGKVFFFLDSESAGSENESPPGQIYKELSPDLMKVFYEKTPIIKGPNIDRWGTWISSFVPIIDNKTNSLVAVIGLDIDYNLWKKEIGAQVFLPIGLVISLMILMISSLVANQKTNHVLAKPVQRLLLVPLAIVLFMLVGGFSLILIRTQQQNMQRSAQQLMENISLKLSEMIKEKIDAMEVIQEVILNDENVLDQLKSKDIDSLLREYSPVFEKIKDNYAITHFYFHGPDRINLLRLHKPEKKGDLIDRTTIVEAERTGRTFSGIELGPLGTFTLRVVKPIYYDEILIGYLELGKEIEDIISNLHKDKNVEVEIFIMKDILDKTLWEQGMSMLGRKFDWDRYPDKVSIYSSLNSFSLDLDNYISKKSKGNVQASKDIKINGKTCKAMTLFLKDVSGSEVGEMIVLLDVSSMHKTFRHVLFLTISIAIVLLSSLIGFLYVMLKRTEQSIHFQQAKLVGSEARLNATLHSIGDAVISTDVNGHVEDMNVVAEHLTGWTLLEALGKKIEDIFQIVNGSTKKIVDNPIKEVLETKKTVMLLDHTILISRTGAEYHISDSAAPIHNNQDTVIGAVLVFRDASKEYQMRKEIEEGFERFNQLAQQSKKVTWEVNADGVYTYVSPIMEWVSGYRPDELVGKKHFYDLCPKSGSKKCKMEVLKYFERKESFVKMERQVECKEDKIIWVETDGMPVFGVNGELSGYRGSDSDITERKKAEQELKDSEDNYRNLFESSMDAIMVINAGNDNRYIKGNKQAIKMFNCKDEKEFLSFSPITFSPKLQPDGRESSDKAREMIRTAIEKGSHFFEWTHKRVTGEEFPASVLLSRVETKGQIFVLATLRDLTERKKIEKVLQQNIDRFQGIADSMADWIWEVDSKMKYTYCSSKVINVLGYSFEEILGKSPLDFIVPEERESALKLFKESASQKKQIKNFEQWNLTKDGKRVCLSTSGVPVVDENGELIGYRGVDADITERKRAEQEVKRAMAIKNEFTSMVSHELRTPLAVIMEGIKIVSDGSCGAINDEQKDYLNTAERNVERLGRLINDVLDIQKMEAGMQEFNMKKDDINSCISFLKSAMEPVAKKLGLTLELNLNKEIPQIMFDKDKIEQVLTNLLNNAMKFTEKGKISIITGTESNCVKVSVKDTGPGIKKEDTGKIFDKFEQLLTGNERKPGGTGLGLAICKEIILQHGGKIWAESEIGKGSTISFLLPIKERRMVHHEK